MKYMDRRGRITIEENGQDKFLRHLYQDWGGKLCLKVLVQPFVSRIAGAFLNSSLSARMVPGFVKRNGIILSQYEKREFTSYNDFFTRRIRPELRPVAKGENVLISPCDGKVTACPIGQDTTFLIKNTRYTAGQLLDSERLGKHYQGGYALIIRLTVDDYHHYCYPADGRKSINVFIPGKLHTVNPVANDLHPIYKENAREYTLIRTGNFGTIAMMEVGAMMVGKITNCHPGQGFVKKGEEKGYFEFGGSTVVLLLQPGKVIPDADLLENSEKGFETIIRMGEQIGECQLSEGTGKAD